MVAASAEIQNQAESLSGVVVERSLSPKIQDLLKKLDVDIRDMTFKEQSDFCFSLITVLQREEEKCGSYKPQLEISNSLETITGELLRRTDAAQSASVDSELDISSLPRQWASLRYLLDRQSRSHFLDPILYQVAQAPWLAEIMNTNPDAMEKFSPALVELYDWAMDDKKRKEAAVVVPSTSTVR